MNAEKTNVEHDLKQANDALARHKDESESAYSELEQQLKSLQVCAGL